MKIKLLDFLTKTRQLPEVFEAWTKGKNDGSIIQFKEYDPTSGLMKNKLFFGI